MSSSSKTSSNVSSTRPNEKPITDVFASLGIQAACPKSFEAMREHPDAGLLFKAISESFTESSVLRESETEDFTCRSTGIINIPSALLLQASKATQTPLPSENLQELNDIRLKSARERLERLKGQRRILRGLLEEKSAHQAHSIHCIQQNQQPQISEVFSRYKSKIGILRRLIRRDIGSVALDAEISNYHDMEHNFVERVADYASDVAQGYAETSAQTPAVIPPRLISVLRSYGTICAQQTNCEILLARSTAFMTSLSVNDGSYLEMTQTSMNTTLRDIRSRAATCVKRKLEDISEDAFKDLSSEVRAYLLSENMQMQDVYIKTLQACIQAYMDQRLRIHCYQVLVDIIVGKRDTLFDSVSKIAHRGKASGGLIVKETKTETEGGESSQQVTKTNTMDSAFNARPSHDKRLVESLSVDEVESLFFSTSLRDATEVVHYLQKNIGAKKHWIDLESPAPFIRLANDLQDMLASSISVVEALARHFETLSRTNSAAGSASKSWVKHING